MTTDRHPGVPPLKTWLITCPKCGKDFPVYHLEWVSLKCSGVDGGCEEWSDKADWNAVKAKHVRVDRDVVRDEGLAGEIESCTTREQLKALLEERGIEWMVNWEEQA